MMKSDTAKCPDCGETEFSMVSESQETVRFLVDGGDLVPDVMKSEYMCYDSATCTNCGKDFDISELESGDD